jgi:uncharacterized coiled-coil protein SlyX
VLTLREDELDSRLRDRDRTIEDLNLRLRELTLTLRKQQATQDAQTQQIFSLQTNLLARVPPLKRKPSPRTPPASTRKKKPNRATLSGTAKARRQSKLKTSARPKTSRKRQRR